MLRNLQAEMVRKNLEPIDIAKTIESNEKTVRNKITERTSFTFPEAKTVRDKHFPGMTLEYLFSSDKTDTSEAV